MKEQDYLMVDLGLPSGLKWADRNVGAETPQDNGLYFSWGNVDGHAVNKNRNVADGYSFDKNTYATTLGGLYTGSALDAEHDAATVNIGEKWRMPTSAEILELIQETDHYYIDESGNTVAGPFDYMTIYSDKGLDGYKLRSICFIPSGITFNYNVDVCQRNFIEFPLAGSCVGSLLVNDGFIGSVWSSSVYEVYSESARDFGFYSDGGLDVDNYYRFFGFSVRGVTLNNN